MKKNILKKSISALTAFAICVSMTSFSVFAQEKVISDEESFVSSYEGDAQAVAQYLLNNGCSVEEATPIMDCYLIGKEELISNSAIDNCYYSSSRFSPTPHYIVVISSSPKNAKEDVNLFFEGDTSFISPPSENFCKICSPYTFSDITNISSSITTYSDIWNYKISISNIKSIDKNEAQPMIILPISKGLQPLTDEDMYKDIVFNYNINTGKDLLAFETFSLGDVNHDGQVTEADLALLLKVQSGLDTFEQDYKDGSNHYSGVTNEVASDVNFDGTVDLKDVELIKAYLDGTYNLGDPVPEQTEEEKFVSSYEGDAQTVAQYLIDNNYSVEKATPIMERYLNGEKEFEEKNAINSAYYNHDDRILDIPHYALVIMIDYSNEKIDLYFESSTTKVLAPDENTCEIRFLYDSNLPNINTSLNYSTEDNRKWSYKISISETLKLDNAINVQPLIMFSINPAIRSSTEYELNNGIKFDYNLDKKINICAFETFALGDTNHDGQVTEADLALLLKIQTGLDTFEQDYKDGSNHYSGVTNEVASDVNFDGTVDLKDVELIKAYLDGTYNLGDPVPEQTEEEKFVSSYEGDAQTVAQYLVENSYSVEKAKSIMECYLQGEKEITEKNIKNTAYYNNDTKISDISHYVLIISIEPVEQQDINICLKSTNTMIKLKDENNYRLLLNNFSIDTSLTYTSSNLWEYNISIPNMPKVESEITSQALISIPIEAGARCCVEEDFYKYIDLNYDIKSGNGLYTYETFALGDTNHDGQVTEADLALLLKIQAGLDTFKQDYKDGSNHYSGVTNEVASDVNFDGTVDLKDVELIKAYLDGTYNLGDPVPEQTEEEKFVSSYEGDAQTVAQYLLDNNYSIEEATPIMECYLNGEKEFTTKNIKDTPYYCNQCNDSSLQHYVLVISVDSEKKQEDVHFSFLSSFAEVSEPNKDSCKLCFPYNSSKVPTINTSLSYPLSGEWQYDISIPYVEALHEPKAQPMITIPIGFGFNIASELNLNKGIKFDYDCSTSNITYCYETFALGDTNHDGQVTEADLALLLKIQTGLDTFEQDYKDGSNHYSGVTNEVASDVNFDGTVDLKDVELIKAYLDGTYNLGDPVPEQTGGNVLYGDTNGDQKVSLTDVILLNKSIAGTYQIPEGLITSVDVYKDSIIDFVDTTSLLRGMLGLVKLPVIPE